MQNTRLCGMWGVDMEVGWREGERAKELFSFESVEGIAAFTALGTVLV